MSVASYVPPDYGNMADGSEYAGANDGAHMVVHELAGQFAPHQSEPTPNLQIVIDAGRIEDPQGAVLDIAQQSSAGLTAPTGNPRHDLVYIDEDGVIGVEQGAEAGSPVDPSWPAAAVKKIARIVWTVGAAQITNTMIEDLRMPGGAGGGLWQEIALVESASFVASLDIEVGFTDDINFYAVDLRDIESAGNGRANLLFKIGASWNQANYHSLTWRSQHDGAATETYQGWSPLALMLITSQNVVSAASEPSSGYLEIENARKALWTYVSGRFQHPAASSIKYRSRFFAMHENASKIDGIRFRVEGGNVKGSMRLYGRA